MVPCLLLVMLMLGGIGGSASGSGGTTQIDLDWLLVWLIGAGVGFVAFVAGAFWWWWQARLRGNNRPLQSIGIGVAALLLLPIALLNSGGWPLMLALLLLVVAIIRSVARR